MLNQDKKDVAAVGKVVRRLTQELEGQRGREREAGRERRERQDVGKRQDSGGT